MGYNVYRVRRKFQYNGWVYSPSGRCECSSNPGSDREAYVISPTESNRRKAMTDNNPCASSSRCTGMTGTGCTCGDAGYCGLNGGLGACGIKPHQYGGDIWIVREGDTRQEHIVRRRFVVYDAALLAAEELLKQPKYRMLVDGEPIEGKILFQPAGESIVAVDTSDENKEPVISNSESPDKEPVVSNQASNKPPVPVSASPTTGTTP